MTQFVSLNHFGYPYPQIELRKLSFVIKAHKIKLNSTEEQAHYFLRAAGIARFAWSWALAEYHQLKAAPAQ